MEKIKEVDIIFDWGMNESLTEYYTRFLTDDFVYTFGVKSMDEVPYNLLNNTFLDYLYENYLNTSEMLDYQLDNNIIMITDDCKFSIPIGNNLKYIIQPFGCEKYCIHNNGIDIKFTGLLKGKEYNYIFRKINGSNEEKEVFMQHVKNKTLTNEIVNKFTKPLVPFVLDCLVKD